MVKDALFTIGVLALLGGTAIGALSVMAAYMSDAPDPDVDLVTPGVIAAVGVVMTVGACFL